MGTEGAGVVETGGVCRPGDGILREKAVVQRRIRGKTEGKTKGNKSDERRNVKVIGR